MNLMKTIDVRNEKEMMHYIGDQANMLPCGNVVGHSHDVLWQI